MNIENLRANEGRTAILRFRDGHVVKARLVHVDADDRAELIYDVVEVLEAGQPEWGTVRPGATATAPLGELADFEPLPASS